MKFEIWQFFTVTFDWLVKTPYVPFVLSPVTELPLQSSTMFAAVALKQVPTMLTDWLSVYVSPAVVRFAHAESVVAAKGAAASTDTKNRKTAAFPTG